MEEKINEREALNLLDNKNNPIECHEIFSDGENKNLYQSYSKILFIYNMFVFPFIACFKCAFFGVDMFNTGNLNDKNSKIGEYSIGFWDRFWTSLFLLTFICGVVGLAVGIVLNLLVLKIIAVVLDSVHIKEI